MSDNEMMEIRKGEGLQEVVINRQAQEVQAAMIMAKRFPRDEIESSNKIRKACLRKGLAEQAQYKYPRGGELVVGASIRLAEAIAQNWGNMDYGIIELSRKVGSSEMMAYAWDMETNTRRTMVFNAVHVREKKSGNKDLTDPRDVYELIANMGARRMRACILAVIPSDIVEDAIKTCNETMKNSYTEPLKERCKKMVAVFDDKFRVTKKMLETYFGYNLDVLTEDDYVKLLSIHNSMKDGMSKREDWFEVKVNAVSSLDKTEIKGEENENDKKDSI